MDQFPYLFITMQIMENIQKLFSNFLNKVGKHFSFFNFGEQKQLEQELYFPFLFSSFPKFWEIFQQPNRPLNSQFNHTVLVELHICVQPLLCKTIYLQTLNDASCQDMEMSDI